MSDAPVPTTPSGMDRLLARLEAVEALGAEQAATIAAYQAEVAAQRVEMAAQRTRIAELERARPVAAGPAAHAKPGRGVSRGQFFRAAAVAAGAVVAGALARPETAKAGSATGEALQLGQENSATGAATTGVTNPGVTASNVFQSRVYASPTPPIPANSIIALSGQVQGAGLDTPNRPEIGVFGSVEPISTTTPGSVAVMGDCRGLGTGVLGQSAAGVGTYGNSKYNIGIVGVSETNYGVVGQSPNYAGVFYGHVYVTGNHYVGGGKFAAVKAADGTHRALHAVEAPDAWFEDVGRAQLANGKASVRLDPEYVGVVAAQDYHVFLTPRGDTKGLFVGKQTPAGFEVQEVGGGTGSIAFDYRVMARRHDLVGRPRLEKVTVPEPPTLPPLLPLGPAVGGPKPK